MSDTPFGRCWEAWRLENIPRETGYVYDRVLRAFHAGWSGGEKYAADLLKEKSQDNQTGDA
jgi:hypothetical protein